MDFFIHFLVIRDEHCRSDNNSRAMH